MRGLKRAANAGGATALRLRLSVGWVRGGRLDLVFELEEEEEVAEKPPSAVGDGAADGAADSAGECGSSGSCE